MRGVYQETWGVKRGKHKDSVCLPANALYLHLLMEEEHTGYSFQEGYISWQEDQ